MRRSYLKALIHISLSNKTNRSELNGIYVDELNSKPIFIATNGHQLVICKEEAAIKVQIELNSFYNLKFERDYTYYNLIKINKLGTYIEKKIDYPPYKKLIPNSYSNPKEIPHFGDWKNTLQLQNYINGFQKDLYIPEYWNGPREAMVSLYDKSNVLFLVMPFCANIEDRCGVQTELNFFKEVKSEKKFWRKKKHE